MKLRSKRFTEQNNASKNNLQNYVVKVIVDKTFFWDRKLLERSLSVGLCSPLAFSSNSFRVLEVTQNVGNIQMSPWPRGGGKSGFNPCWRYFCPFWRKLENLKYQARKANELKLVVHALRLKSEDRCRSVGPLAFLIKMGVGWIHELYEESYFSEKAGCIMTKAIFRQTHWVQTK